MARTAAAIRDPSFRIQVTRAGLHVYNRDGHRIATDPFELWPGLGVDDDASHAFYLGVELGRAQIAWQLGKRYLQDNELEWGVAVRGATAPGRDGSGRGGPGHTVRGATVRGAAQE